MEAAGGTKGDSNLPFHLATIRPIRTYVRLVRTNGNAGFDLSDELYAETVLKHSTRLVPRGAAAWSASPRNWLRSIIEEKERGWKEK